MHYQPFYKILRNPRRLACKGRLVRMKHAQTKQTSAGIARAKFALTRRMKRASANLWRIKFKRSPPILTQTASKLACRKRNPRKKTDPSRIQSRQSLLTANEISAKARPFIDPIHAQISASLREQTRTNRAYRSWSTQKLDCHKCNPRQK